MPSTCGRPPRRRGSRSPSRARELIGKDPGVWEEFDVEATIEGHYALDELSRRGLAFE